MAQRAGQGVTHHWSKNRKTSWPGFKGGRWNNYKVYAVRSQMKRMMPTWIINTSIYQIFWCTTIETFTHKNTDFKQNSLSKRQSMQFIQNWCDVVKFRCTYKKLCCPNLNRLKHSSRFCWQTEVQSVPVIKSRVNKSVKKTLQDWLVNRGLYKF